MGRSLPLDAPAALTTGRAAGAGAPAALPAAPGATLRAVPVFDPIAELMARVTKGRDWPPKSEAATWRRVLSFRAFLDSDREDLKVVADWRDRNRELKVDPIGERIAEAWADHLFSEDVEVTPAADADADRLGEIIAGNDLTEECRAAERDFVVPEGEGWWRAYRDPDISDVPLLEWHSRATVAPFYIGKRLLAVALITELEGKPLLETARNAIFRHFECHAEGEVRHFVFRGTKDRLGTEVGLDAHSETVDLLETAPSGVWLHGGPMLMGRVINKRGRSPRIGVSEYNGIKDLLLDLNESLTIGSENMRLVAKRRIVVSASTVDVNAPAQLPTGDALVDVGDGSLVPVNGRSAVDFAAGEGVLVADPVNEELGRDSAAPFKVLEYTFDAEPLIAWRRELVTTALTRIGITPQWAGVSTGESDGFAVSGTALRLRLIPTTKAGNGKGKAWDTELPRALTALQGLDALEPGRGGNGNQWADPLSPPGVRRGDAVPQDEVEDAQVDSALISAGARSRFTSVKRQHPEWSDDDVKEELDRISEDRASSAPAGGLFGGAIA